MGKFKTRKDLTGQKFGRLTVIKYAYTKKKVAITEITNQIIVDGLICYNNQEINTLQNLLFIITLKNHYQNGQKLQE